MACLAAKGVLTAAGRSPIWTRVRARPTRPFLVGPARGCHRFYWVQVASALYSMRQCFPKIEPDSNRFIGVVMRCTGGDALIEG
jgi:hypothetical protein